MALIFKNLQTFFASSVKYKHQETNLSFSQKLSSIQYPSSVVMTRRARLKF